MFKIYAKFVILSALLSTASCATKTESKDCIKPTLTDLAIGDKVPKTAKRKRRHSIMASPGQFQPEWTYSECGISYTLGVDTEGYVQFMSTIDEFISGSDEIGVGTVYSKVMLRTGKTALKYPGWLHAVDLTDDWRAGFYVNQDELPPDAPVLLLFKGNGAGHGRRND